MNLLQMLGQQSVQLLALDHLQVDFLTWFAGHLVAII